MAYSSEHCLTMNSKFRQQLIDEAYKLIERAGRLLDEANGVESDCDKSLRLNDRLRNSLLEGTTK